MDAPPSVDSIFSVLSLNSGLPIYETNGDIDPPLYRHTRLESTSTRQRAEHVYNLMNSKNQPWATLKFHSAARYPDHVPVLFEGDAITGTLEINVNKDHILEIVIVAAGRIVTSVEDYDSGVFLNLSHIIWSRSMGDPRSSTPSETAPPYTEKLHGHYFWPFTFTLPRQITLSSDSISSSAEKTFYLPPSFLERNTRVSVQYDIYAHIRRGKFRPNSKLGTILLYVPCIKPEPPSALRQLAYQEGSPILGPDIDPDGWKTLKSIFINGTIFRNRSVDAKCTLSLAKPLCYTRGTTIPCVMVIESSDEQALDLLSSPRAAVVRLQRRVTCSTEAETHRTHIAGKGWRAAVDYPGTAVFWPGPTGDEGTGRRLDGEIQLSKHLKPSSALMHFSITYSIVVFPFEAIAFYSANKDPLLTEKVEIGTLYAQGPRPKAYSPPTYSDSSSKGSRFTIGGSSDFA